MQKKRYVCSNPECANVKNICKHLNKQLPKGSQQSIRAIMVKDIEKVHTTAETSYNASGREAFFRDKLYRFGLEAIRVDVLTLYFVYGCSLSEIAAILSIPTADKPSKAAVHRIYKQSLRMLKNRGYSL